MLEGDGFGVGVEDVVINVLDIGGQLTFLLGGKELILEGNTSESFLFPPVPVKEVDQLLDS